MGKKRLGCSALKVLFGSALTCHRLVTVSSSFIHPSKQPTGTDTYKNDSPHILPHIPTHTFTTFTSYCVPHGAYVAHACSHILKVEWVLFI